MRQRIADALARVKLSDIVGRYTKLSRAGRELSGLCVFHNERSPSLQVNDAKGLYHCFGCGASGDALSFLVEHAGMKFMDALRDIEDGTYPEVDPAQRARAMEEDAAERAAAIAEARAIWDDAAPATGTLAETYLRSRGITVPLPPSIRFARTYSWRDPDTGETGPDRPALIGSVVDGTGELVGIQRIFLAPDGRGKADMRHAKLSLGRTRGGALRLGPPASEITVCEGPEDGFTLMQEFPGRSVWVTLGTANMPEIQYPAEVRRIVLAGDNNEAGRLAVRKAAEALDAKGYDVRFVFPAAGFADFNDQLRGIRQ